MGKVAWRHLAPDDPIFKRPFYVSHPITGPRKDQGPEDNLAGEAGSGEDAPENNLVLQARTEIVRQIHQNPPIMQMRSTFKELFGYPEDEFDRMWTAYTLSLRVIGGKERDWNVEIEDMLRKAGISEEQIELARTDLAAAIFQRMILRMATDGWVSPEAPAEP